MLKIKAITSKSIDENGNEIDVLSPASEIPQGSKVRFIDGEFQAIPQDEEWPE